MGFPAYGEELQFIGDRKGIGHLRCLYQFPYVSFDRVFSDPAVDPWQLQFLGQLTACLNVERIVRSAGVAGDRSGVLLS